MSQPPGDTPIPDVVTSVQCALVTISDNRTLEDDEPGRLAEELLTAAGHRVTVRQFIADDSQPMRDLLRGFRDRPDIEAVIITGGTGLRPRDQTVETLIGLFDKRLPGYGELFRWLSYMDIGARAMLTRATAGLMGRTVVFSMPGSTAGVRRALEKLILPELPRLVAEART